MDVEVSEVLDFAALTTTVLTLWLFLYTAHKILDKLNGHNKPDDDAGGD